MIKGHGWRVSMGSKGVIRRHLWESIKVGNQEDSYIMQDILIEKYNLFLFL